jgi:hypothetical protein
MNRYLLSIAACVVLGAAGKPHSHGNGQLLVVLEDKTLSTEFITDMGSIVGFERLPKTEEEHKAIAEAKARLASPASLMALAERAECQLDSADISIPGDDAHQHDYEHHDHDKEHHDHDKAHHDHDHDSDHDHEKKHLDVEVRYSFTCAKPGQLKQIQFAGFQSFPGLEKIETAIFADNKQSGAILTAGKASFSLR